MNTVPRLILYAVLACGIGLRDTEGKYSRHRRYILYLFKICIFFSEMTRPYVSKSVSNLMMSFS